jgi:alpha-1,3/alpha-1,6-mannosyltransferase
MSRPRLRIAILHPGLGIGGAERLIVDVAAQLARAGHEVTIFTGHWDPARSFELPRDGSLDVRVYDCFLPHQIGQRLRAPCTILRLAYVILRMAGGHGPFDVVICDLVSHVLPLVKALTRAKILFYCHFPDLLLTPSRRFLYRLYRAPIDWLEGSALGAADRILVNSEFTADTVRRVFPRLASRPLDVVHPGVDVERLGALDGASRSAHHTILSLNRFSPGKRLEIAIEALAIVRERMGAVAFGNVRLVVAGGYDDHIVEQRAYLASLHELVRSLDLDEHVSFAFSIDDAERERLLAECRCVVYTPENEHFGIVPIEAMASSRPVIAVRSGGPLETVRDGETGFLCEPTPKAFATAIVRVLAEPDSAERMGRAARAHVVESFSVAAFGAKLDAIVRGVVTA